MRQEHNGPIAPLADHLGEVVLEKAVDPDVHLRAETDFDERRDGIKQTRNTERQQQIPMSVRRGKMPACDDEWY